MRTLKSFIAGMIVAMLFTAVDGSDDSSRANRQAAGNTLEVARVQIRGEARLSISATAKKKARKKLKKSREYRKLPLSTRRKLGGVKTRPHDGKIRTPGKPIKA